MTNPERKKRFIQEAKAASALNHPNIITVHEIANDDNADFIVMEYLAGTTLDQLIGPTGLRLPAALNYATQIAAGTGGGACGRHRSSGFKTAQCDDHHHPAS